MSDTTPFTIGAEVSCRDSDGSWGHLDRLVVDPIGRVVTHLVVEPTHRRGLGRLVPVGLVTAGRAAGGGAIALACTVAELEAMEDAEETRFLPGSGVDGYDPATTLSWPYYGLAAGGMGATMGSLGLSGLENGPQPVIVDRVPPGEVEIHRGDPVRASDGDIGRVQGLVVDPASRRVTHVLLAEGHLWGKKQVAIPVRALGRLDAGAIEVRLTKDQIKDLAPVELEP